MNFFNRKMLCKLLRPEWFRFESFPNGTTSTLLLLKQYKVVSLKTKDG